MLGKMHAWVQANRDRLGAIGLTFALVWLWVTFVLMCVSLLAIKDGNGGSDFLGMLYEESLPHPLKALFGGSSPGESFLWAFLGLCVAAPLVEEGFRAGLCELCETKEGGLRYHFLLLAGSCLGFGLLHGGGYFSILIQGSLGLGLGLLWFRLRRNADGTLIRKRWPYLANVAVHAAYNFCVLGIQILVLRSHM